MIAMNDFTRDRIAHLCDINNLPEQRFLEYYEFIRQSYDADKSLKMTLEGMAHFKCKLDQINMDLASMGLLKKVTYEEL